MTGISLVPTRELGIAASWGRLAEATGDPDKFALQIRVEALVAEESHQYPRYHSFQLEN